MSLQPQYVLLTVTAGECHTPQQRFAWGVASPFVSVGARANWIISGEGIADVHLLLSFDGSRVRAAAPNEAAKVHVDGASELGVESQIMNLPFELRFGSARLAGQVVGSCARASGVLPDFAADNRGDPSLAVTTRRTIKTQLLDLSVLRPPGVEGHAPAPEAHAPALEGRATLSVDRAAAPFQVVSGSTLTWSLGTLLALPPSRAPSRAKAEDPATPPPEPALDRTLCDGGALRDYARQLVANASEPVSPGAGKREPLARSPKLKRAARMLPLPRRLLDLRVRRRFLVMPVLASLGLLPWLLGTPSAAQSSRADAPSRLAEAASAEPPAPEAPAPEVPAVSAPVVEVLPVEMSAADPAVPAAAEVLAAETAPDPSAAPSRPTVRPSSKRLEQDAFRAAFGGSVDEAAALYEELARIRSEPVFEHAARLVRQNRVHKP